MPARVNTEAFEAEVLKADVPVLVDFYSDSCVPCKRLSPVLSKLETELEGKVKIVKVNVAYEEELVETYEVQAAPTLVFFKGGAEAARLRGAFGREDILAEIEKL